MDFAVSQIKSPLLFGSGLLLWVEVHHAVAVLRAALAVLKTVSTRFPKKVSTPITINAISETSKPYSTRVYPSSSK